MWQLLPHSPFKHSKTRGTYTYTICQVVYILRMKHAFPLPHNAEATHFALNYMFDRRIKLVCLLLDAFLPLLERIMVAGTMNQVGR
jgi:hypothetical protein